MSSRASIPGNLCQSLLGSRYRSQRFPISMQSVGPPNLEPRGVSKPLSDADVFVVKRED